MVIDLPNAFVHQLNTEWPNQANTIVNSIKEGVPPVSLRINPGKLSQNMDLDPIPWSACGYYLAERPSFISDPWWHAGAYYVQEASSMLIEQAIKQYVPQEAITAIDLCAAPGGKTTHLQSLLHPNSLIIANEVIKQRATILAQNVEQWGCDNIWITSHDPERIGQLTHLADVLLIDAPCSGEGLFRRDHNAIQEWSPDHVSLCSNRQQRIVHDVWDALKPGGLLIYSTCTFNLAENEQNLALFTDELGIEWLPLKINANWGLTTQKGINGYHAFPGLAQGEGFFLAVGRKPEEPLNSIQPKRSKRSNLTKLTSTPWNSAFTNPDHYSITPKQTVIQVNHESLFHSLQQVAPTFRTGITIGEEKKGILIPSHAMALAQSLNSEAFSTLDVDLETAYRFLKKEVLPGDLAKKRGMWLLRYQQLPIGWVKHVGNRMNNLLPISRRIHKHFDLKNLWSFFHINANL